MGSASVLRWRVRLRARGVAPGMELRPRSRPEHPRRRQRRRQRSPVRARPQVHRVAAALPPVGCRIRPCLASRVPLFALVFKRRRRRHTVRGCRMVGCAGCVEKARYFSERRDDRRGAAAGALSRSAAAVSSQGLPKRAVSVTMVVVSKMLVATGLYLRLVSEAVGPV
jgi:hypothetical protein